MAITYGPVNIVNFNEIQFVFYGDDVSTVLNVNLSKQPFNLPGFVDASPASYDIDGLSLLGITATISVATVPGVGDVLTATFSAPPPSPAPGSSTAGLTIFPRYTGI